MENSGRTQEETTPRHYTRSKSVGGGKQRASSTCSTTEKRKRSPGSTEEGSMSKKSTADNEPSNALIMRTLNNLSAKFERLPTVDHLNKLESDLHSKMEASTAALKKELREEFQTEMHEQVTKMTSMISEVRSQIDSTTAGASATRNDNQKGRYLRARRSFKIWPLNIRAADKEDEAVRRFFTEQMGVPMRIAMQATLDTVRPADQARGSKITSEYIITFADVESRDTIKSYASGLAAAKGQAGLRLDIPPCLKGSFRILNEHGIAMIKIYGREVKRSIRFDDRNDDLMMDIKLPTSTTWHNITIEQAREARKARDAIDMRNIRQTALRPDTLPVNPSMDREKARALMLAISPSREGQSTNFQSRSGVVHINSEQDWSNFESRGGDEDDGNSTDRSVEELLGGRTRGASRQGSNNTASQGQ